MTVTVRLCDTCGQRIMKCRCARDFGEKWREPSSSEVELFTVKEVERAVRDALSRVAVLAPSAKESCATIGRDPLPEKSDPRRARRRHDVGKRREQGRVLA